MSNPELTHEPSSLDRKARRLARTLTPHSPRPNAAATLGRALGWFGIGLGVVELLAPRSLARWIGLQGSETLLRAYGVREIASGIGLLAAAEPATQARWLEGRVVGDALDAATLAVAIARPSPARAHPVGALVAVAGVAALDVACAHALSLDAQAARAGDTDYSDRSGMPCPPEAMRGAALASFTQPADMRVAPERSAGTPVH